MIVRLPESAVDRFAEWAYAVIISAVPVSAVNGAGIVGLPAPLSEPFEAPEGGWILVWHAPPRHMGRGVPPVVRLYKVKADEGNLKLVREWDLSVSLAPSESWLAEIREELYALGVPSGRKE